MKALGRLARLIQSAGSASLPPERIDIDSDQPDLNALAAAVNQLLYKARRVPQVNTSSAALFAQVGDRVHEVVLLHREAIIYANPQFAQLLGVARRRRCSGALRGGPDRHAGSVEPARSCNPAHRS
jgi:PAS domain-containing protein